jgi:hypothetical protein
MSQGRPLWVISGHRRGDWGTSALPSKADIDSQGPPGILAPQDARTGPEAPLEGLLARWGGKGRRNWRPPADTANVIANVQPNMARYSTLEAKIVRAEMVNRRKQLATGWRAPV